jgi:hypothetical protein
MKMETEGKEILRKKVKVSRDSNFRCVNSRHLS